MLKAFWYRRVPNFGDQLTPWLLAQHGVPVTWSPPARADLFAVGSVAHQIPAGFSGHVWGTGSLKPGTFHLADAQIHALRGPQTGTAALYADPGLLAGLYAPQTAVRHRQGVLAHYIERLPLDGHQIDVQAGVASVIREVAGCGRLRTSSLHGLILADSLGIPSMWIQSTKVVGGSWKYADYASSFGETIRPGVWRLADQRQVAAKQAALVEALGVLR
jgi:hypothetical protein